MIDTGIRFKFRGEEMHLYKGTYAQPRSATALRLLAIDHDIPGKPLVPYMTVTVNVGNDDPDEVTIKDYSENEGIFEVLVENKIVSKPIRFEQTGYVRCPTCKLLI